MTEPLKFTIHPANTMTPAPAGGNDAPDINPGQATPPPMGNGERELNSLHQGGFSNDQIGQYKQQTTETLQQAGFTPDQIEKHWGTPSLTSEALNDHIKRGFETVPEESHEKIAQNPLDALAAGLQMSVAGLAVRGAKPDTTLGEQASIFQRIMYGAGQLAGDLPATVAGAFGGGGVAAGLTAETGPGAVVGGLVGAGAGAAMLPEAMRQTMLDIYKRGEAKTAGEILSMAGESVITTLKAGLLGGVAAPLGAAAGGVAGAVGGKIAKTGADIATQAGVFAGAGAAMEGHLPDAKDFISGAALAAAFHVGQSAVRAGKAKYNARGELEPAKPPEPNYEDHIQVFHGTDAEFENFDITKARNKYEKAVFFSGSRETAEGYGEHLKEAWIPKDRMLKVDREAFHATGRGGDPVDALIERAKREGKAVLEIKLGDDPPMYLVVDPSVIKSARTIPKDDPQKSFEALHGSVHEFSNFRDDRIGTGEGFQTEGHGHYLTDQPDVAKFYANQFTGRATNWKDPTSVATHFMHQASGNREVALETLDRFKGRNDRGYNAEATNKAIELIKNEAEIPEFKGNVYRVKVNADRNMMLDLDRQLVDQPKAVQAGVRTAAREMGVQITDIGTGREIMNALLEKGAPEAAQALKKAGIPGTKFKNEGQSANNYVVFDASKLEIAGRNEAEATSHIQENFEQYWAKLGLTPWDVAEAAKHDAVIRDEMLSQDAHGMPVAPVLARLAPPEPEPYHDSLDHLAPGVKYTTIQSSAGFGKAGERLRIGKDGKTVPAVEEIAEYLSQIGKKLGFSVQIGPQGDYWAGDIDFEGIGPHFGTVFERDANTGKQDVKGNVYLPDNTDEQYQRWVGSTRSEILWHEVGHAVDALHLSGDKGRTTKVHEDPAVKAEMEMASRNFSPYMWDHDPNYVGKPNELMAEAVAVWLSDPTAAARMPEFTAKYGEKLEPLRKIINKAMPVRVENKEWISNEEWKERQLQLRERERKDIQAWKEGGGGIGPPEPPSGGWTSGDPPDWPKIGTEAPRGLHPDVIALKWSAKIGEAPKSTEHWNIDTAMRQIVSELHPARQIDKALHEIGSERFNKNKDIGLEDMFRQTYSSEQRAGYFTKFGTLDATDPTHITHKSDDHFAGAFDKAKKAGGTYEGFRNFLLALRTIDKAGQGIETGFKLDEAMVLAREGMKKYTEVTKEWNRVNRAVLEYGRDRGVFSQGQIDAMTNANELAYVSLRRIAGDAPYAPGGGKGRGFRARNPLHRMEGDDGNIRDPILATLDNTAMIVKMADRNAAIGAVVMLAERGGLEEKGPWARIGKAEATATMAAPGEDKFTPYLKEDLKVPFDPFLAAKATRQGSDKNFVYMRDGVPEVWRAEDPHFAKLMRGADTPGEANFISKVATGFAHAARLGIVMPLDFMVRMPLRDQIGTYVLDPNHPPPFLTWAHGAMEAFGQGKEYREWIANGGGGGAMIDLSSNYLAREMHQSFNDRFSGSLLERTPEQNGFPQIGREGGRELGPYQPENLHETFEKTGTWDAMWNNVQHPIEALELLSQRLDASSRVGYYRRMREAGFTPVKAATMSRKAYLDFSEKATLDFLNTWSKWEPFMRPGILGMKQLGEAVVNDPKRAAWYATTAIIAPSVMLYALNYLQDEYGDLPESRKYRNRDRLERDMTFVFPEVMGFRLKLQTPPELGVLLHGSVDRFMDYLAYDRPVEFKEWAGKVVDSWTPNWMPTIALPAAEQWANKSLSTGRPLIPASMEQASGQLQYTENTTEVAKKLSKVLGPNTGAGIMQVSPIVIDNYVRQWTGTTGFAVMKALSAPFKSDNAPWELSDIPGLNGFISRQPGMNAYPIRQFFDEAKEAKQLVADKTLIKKRQKLGADNQDEVDAYSTMVGLKLDRISKSLYNMREALGAMNNDKSMTTAEKRQFIEQTYSEMIVIAKDGVEFARKFKADQKDNGP